MWILCDRRKEGRKEGSEGREAGNHLLAKPKKTPWGRRTHSSPSYIISKPFIRCFLFDPLSEMEASEIHSTTYSFVYDNRHHRHHRTDRIRQSSGSNWQLFAAAAAAMCGWFFGFADVVSLMHKVNSLSPQQFVARLWWIWGEAPSGFPIPSSSLPQLSQSLPFLQTNAEQCQDRNVNPIFPGDTPRWCLIPS